MLQQKKCTSKFMYLPDRTRSTKMTYLQGCARATEMT